MITINPYLSFNGNCEEAFEFYKSVFGGQFPYVARFKDMPAGSGHQLSGEDSQKIMHMSLPISKETVLMGADSLKTFGQTATFGDNLSLMVSAENREEVDEIFGKLAAGGKVVMPLEVTFWGDYFGMLVDKFGINWMINCQA